MNLDSEFKDQLNYLLAFVAVFLGLIAFKDTAVSHYVLIFAVPWNYFQLSIPLVVGMIAAVYLGGLALLCRRWSFTFFPLNKYLEIFSYGLAAVSLLYPISISLAFAISFGVSHLHIADQFATSVIGGLVGAIIALLSVSLSQRYAVLREKEKVSEQLLRASELQKQYSLLMRKRKTTQPPLGFQVFEHYEHVVIRAKAYLRLKGYGVSGENLASIAEILKNKDVFNVADTEAARRATNLRNAYIHGVKSPDSQEIKQVIKILDKLNAKLNKAFYEASKATNLSQN